MCVRGSVCVCVRGSVCVCGRGSVCVEEVVCVCVEEVVCVGKRQETELRQRRTFRKWRHNLAVYYAANLYGT